MIAAERTVAVARTLPERIARGRVMIAEARARGRDTTAWEQHLAALEAEAAAHAAPERALALRPYQQEALDAIGASPYRRQLVSMATGLGKTVCFAHLVAGVVRTGGRALVLVHRDELVTQTLRKLAVVAPDLDAGVVKAGRNEHTASVVVASVQTLAHRTRLERLEPDFALVVVDEAAHAMAPSWRATLEHLRCFERGGPLTTGWTATPERADGSDLAAIFEGIVYSKDILSGIREGYLCDLRGLRIDLDMDLSGVPSRGGDFGEAELAGMLDRARAPHHVVQAYRDYAGQRKALAYLPGVRLAEQTACLFREAGIPAGAVSGTTPLEERRRTLEALRDGSLRVVANCGVLTEGFDEPSVECILLARPTHSRPLYIQIVGRGARPHPGKDDCLVIDFVGASSRHELVTLGALFGLRHGALHEHSVLEAIAVQEREREREQRRAAAERGRASQQEQRRIADIIGRPVDLFHRKPLHWAQQGDVYALSIPGGSLALHPAGDGYSAVRLEGGRVVEHLAAGQPLPLHYAQGVAEDWARTHDVHTLAVPDAPWRGQPASDKQIVLLNSLGIAVPAGLSGGEASDLITSDFAARTLRRGRRAG